MTTHLYVPNATGNLRRILLCSPTHFSLQPINEITRHVLAKGEQADLHVLKEEYRDFVAAYREAGVAIELMEPVEGFPYLVYARDFGACLAEGVLIGRFREPIRQGEERLYAEKIRQLNIPIIGRITRGCFEGGDFWLLDECTVVQGVCARTDWEGVRNAQEILEPFGYKVCGVQIDSKYLHLDMAFNIVAPRVAVAVTSILPDFFLKMLTKRKYELIDVPPEGVFAHHCNIQALGSDRVLTFAGNTIVNKHLKALGFEVITPELTQILKGGGGPHCMTFPLQRDV